MYERKKTARERRVKGGSGKLDIGEEKLLLLISQDKVNTQMQHCILKVFKKMRGSDKEQFLAAANVCAGNFTSHGYQKSGSMLLTSKGVKNNRRHQRESNAGSKKAKFKTLAKRVWSEELKQLAQADQKG